MNLLPILLIAPPSLLQTDTTYYSMIRIHSPSLNENGCHLMPLPPMQLKTWIVFILFYWKWGEIKLEPVEIPLLDYV